MNRFSKNIEQIELLSLLRLYNIPKISTLNAHKLIQIYGSATTIFKKQFELLNSKNFKIDSDFFSKKYLTRAMRDYQLAHKMNYKVIGHGLSGYPKPLLECEDAPLILFSSGAIDWNTHKWISIVGTRKASPEALKLVRHFIEELAVYQPTIVSGLAYGIDITAHKAALDNNLQTIACLGHGLQMTYPRAHHRIRTVMEHSGGVISEFLPNETPLPHKFVQRNRIIAGLSKAVLVIESPVKGGSLITADLANSYQREVYALPNRITDQHQGCNVLIRDCKAQLVSSAKDLVSYLGWD